MCKAMRRSPPSGLAAVILGESAQRHKPDHARHHGRRMDPARHDLTRPTVPAPCGDTGPADGRAVKGGRIDVLKWKIGDVTITKLVELEVTGGSRFLLPQATPEVIKSIAWLQPHFADENGRLRMSIHSFIVETPSRRIVVDTCLGNDKENRRIPHWNNREGRSW